jgi:hypothetical protein
MTSFCTSNNTNTMSNTTHHIPNIQHHNHCTQPPNRRTVTVRTKLHVKNADKISCSPPKCVATAPISTKLTFTQQHYMDISYAEFRPDRSGNMENTRRNSFTPVNKPRLSRSRFKRVRVSTVAVEKQ